ncbi:MAG: sugar phosphate isomerase/epimerase [Ruminococcaceae bacterium]|nr:sugar phosphate isomerase/epimerase [Oscillospiraceae bacterium]
MPMKISTTTGRLAKAHGEAEAIRMIANAGFDCYDYSNFSIVGWEENPVFGADWEAYADSLNAAAKEAGISCNQSHAPFPSRKMDGKPEDEAYNEIIFDKLERSIRFAGRLGAKSIVVHPIKAFPHFGKEAYWKDLNMDFYRSLAPIAKEAGIRIALENMFVTDPNRKIYTESTCGDPREFADWLDTLADDCFTGCLDLGHCQLGGYDTAYAIRTLGADRLGALHVHDNDYKVDQHMPPFCFNTEAYWVTVTEALAEIGYRGDMTLESDRMLVRLPVKLYPTGLRFMHDVARYLADQAEAK